MSIATVSTSNSQGADPRRLWQTISQYAQAAGTSVVAMTRIASKWMVGDVTFAVLPLLVMAMVYALTDLPFDNFLELKEWSFANIVFFGVAQNRMTSLRDAFPRQSKSWRTSAGTQLFGLGLIASVLVLGIVILDEHNLLKEDAHLSHLATAQLFLFITGLFSILICVLADEALNVAATATGDTQADAMQTAEAADAH